MAIKWRNLEEARQGEGDTYKIVIAEIEGTIWAYIMEDDIYHSFILEKLLVMNRIEFETIELYEERNIPVPQGESYRVIGMGYISFEGDRVTLSGDSADYGLAVNHIGHDLIEEFCASTGLPVFVQ